MPTCVFFPNPFNPADKVTHCIAPGTNLQKWLDATGYSQRMREQPLLVKLNGRELLQAQYDCELRANDVVHIDVLAEGLESLAIILIATTVAAAALTLLMPEPEIPGFDTEEASSTYSLSARGNKARLGRPKPVLYGTMRVYPDYSASAFSEYDGNSDQYVYQLFEVTQGYAAIDENTARFEDTLLSSFDNYEFEVIHPGEVSTIFPRVVDVSSEVSNLELLDAGLGPYAANPAATAITRIAIDVVATGGIYELNDSGDTKTYSVEYSFDVREIDDAGAPLGSWLTLGTHTMSAASRDALRRTHSYVLTAGRYETRLNRLTPESDSTRIGDKLQWAQLKGYIADTSITSTTRIAVKIRSSEQLGNKALSKFNVVASRYLPTWSSGGGWTGNVQTNSPVWAFADACRADYGAKRSDAYIDLVALESLAPVLAGEAVEFNGIFDTKNNVWDALTAILMPARARPVDNAGVYTVVRDTQASVPVQMFSMRNIVRDSFKIDYAGVLEETADSIRAEFFDAEQDYRSAQFTATLSGGTTNNPRDVGFFGITSKDLCFKLAQYMNAQNYYLRDRYTFETGIEGRIPFYGDLISINHYLLGREDGSTVISGDVVAFDGVDTLTVSEKVSGVATPYIALRDQYGAPIDAYQCVVLDDYRVQITDGSFSAGDVLAYEPGKERQQFALGPGTDFSMLAKIEKIEPAGDGKIKITCYKYRTEVYTAADGLSVPPITQLPALVGIAPVITKLNSVVRGTAAAPLVYLSWLAENSDYFEVEYSYNNADFFPADEGRELTQKFSHKPAPGVVYYRVAGVNILRGTWVTIAVDTNSVIYQAPLTPTSLALRESFTGPILKLQWASDVYDHVIEFWKSGVKKYSETIQGLTYDLPAAVAQEYGLGRAFDVRAYAVANGEQSASYASLSVSNAAPAVLNNLAVTPFLGIAKIDFDWPTDADLSGISVWASTSSGFTPSDATLVLDAARDPVLGVPLDEGETLYIKAAAVDVWGGDSLNYSGQYTATGKTVDLTSINDDLATLNGKFPIQTVDIGDDQVTGPKVVANSIGTLHLIAEAVTAATIKALEIQGYHVAAATLTADKVNIAYLSAIAADMGIVTGGTFKTTSGTTYRVEMSSAGNFPLWIGTGTVKNEANALMYIDKTTGELVYKGQLSVKSAASGERTEISDSVIKVYDSEGVLRVKIGDLTA